MKRLAMYFFVLPLLVAPLPVYAQTVTPPPASGVVGEVADAAERLGTLNVIMLVIVVGVVVLTALAAKYVVVPLINAVTTLTAQVTGALSQSSVVMQRMVDMTSKLETSDEARERREAVETAIGKTVETAHAETRKQVNEHTDEAMKPIAQKFDAVIQMLNDDREKQSKRDEKTDGMLAEATRELLSLKNAVMKLTDTGSLDASKVPSADPAAPPTAQDTNAEKKED